MNDPFTRDRIEDLEIALEKTHQKVLALQEQMQVINDKPLENEQRHLANDALYRDVLRYRDVIPLIEQAATVAGIDVNRIKAFRDE